MLWNTIRLIEPNLRFYQAIILARYDYFQIKSLVLTSNLLPMKFLIHDKKLDKRYFIIQVIGNIVQIHKWRLYPFILKLSLIFYDEPRFAYELITNMIKHLFERMSYLKSCELNEYCSILMIIIVASNYCNTYKYDLLW